MQSLPEGYAESLMRVEQTKVNFKGDELLELMKYENKTREKYHAAIPIIGDGVRWGTVLMARYEPEFNDEDIVLAEVGATAVGIEFQRVKSLEKEEEEREQEIVRMAISTLSYSETEAVQKIFDELKERDQTEQRDADEHQRLKVEDHANQQQREREHGADAARGNDGVAQADRRVALRILNRVAALVRRDADRSDARHVVHIVREADDLLRR